MPIRFTYHQKYNLHQFIDYVKSHQFESLVEAKNYIYRNLPKVLAIIFTDRIWYITFNGESWQFIKSLAKFPVKFTNSDGQPDMVDFPNLVRICSDRLPHFTKCVFKPLNIGLTDDEFNFWVGFKAKKVAVTCQAIIDAWEDLVFRIVANDDPVVGKWYMDWLAHIVQRPHIKSEVVPVLIGKQGIGKTTASSIFTNWVLGRHLGVSVEGIDRIVQRFNTIFQNKVFITVEEMPSFVNEFHAKFDSLKEKITGRTVFVEPKGQEGFEIGNCVNFQMNSNNIFAVKIEESDRRFCPIMCSDSEYKNAIYWDTIYDLLDNQEGGDQIFTYLLNRDISSVNLRYDMPITKLKEEIMNLSLSSVKRFDDELVNQIKSSNDDPDFRPSNPVECAFIHLKHNPEHIIPTSKLYDFYRQYCHSVNDQPKAIRYFSLELKQVRTIKNYTTKRISHTFYDDVWP